MIKRITHAQRRSMGFFVQCLLYCLFVAFFFLTFSGKALAGGMSVLPPASQYTSLMRAALEGDFNYVKELISSGIDINEEGGNNATALMAATAGDNLDIVRYLLNKGADPHKKTSNNLNALTIAACGNIHILNEYLNVNVDTNLEYSSPPFFRGPALVEAVGCKRIKNVQAILKKGKNKQNSIQKAIYVAGANKYNKILSILLQHKKLRIHSLAKNNGLVRQLYEKPNTDLEKLSIKEKKILSELSYYEIKAVKNAIFARKGYTFKAIWLDKYFSNHFEEYKPITKKIILSDMDKKNLKLLRNLEKIQGSKIGIN